MPTQRLQSRTRHDGRMYTAMTAESSQPTTCTNQLSNSMTNWGARPSCLLTFVHGVPSASSHQTRKLTPHVSVIDAHIASNAKADATCVSDRCAHRIANECPSAAHIVAWIRPNLASAGGICTCRIECWAIRSDCAFTNWGARVGPHLPIGYWSPLALDRRLHACREIHRDAARLPI